ncbi:MAG TPA: hypothetical protein P5519_06970 [Spirochaetia bacterium]|nr:hypothetical protein [Spirochaetales bacterium]HRS65614.1 hypothetical protein [Spirochaetia bacterium]HOT59215.1 hypothetical protein [Spirochaetales bacterium]HPD80802.1 hypothetical protein [Spirochaetales bacterium]HQK33827.1 hypothetical protein [Spirochaetales bacterium]
MHDDAWSFSQIDTFLQKLTPLSVWAKDEHAKCIVYTDRKKLETLYDDIDAVFASLEASPSSIAQDRISYHLKRLPRIPLTEKDTYEIIELFQFKKFLTNFRAICHEITPDIAERFALKPVAREATALLEQGGSDAETFFLADSYHPSLPEIRKRIVIVQELISKAKHTRDETILEQFDIALNEREFVIVDTSHVTENLTASPLVNLEPYDDNHFIVKPSLNAELIKLEQELEKLRNQEQLVEQEVITELSKVINTSLTEIHRAIEAIIRYDRARACALFITSYKLTRPCLSSNCLTLHDGRYIPCEEECTALGLAYTPLTISLQKNTTVLFGSNMGGKTVALKTLLFFQLLAQCGFFVPARSFETRVYKHIRYVGELYGERLTGLSGFGFEIWRFNSVWSQVDDGLIAFDEFARTTGSHEAEALLSAVVDAYRKKPAITSIFATHFRGIERYTDVYYIKMKGLNHEQAVACLDEHAPLKDRLMSINQHMCYAVCPDTGSDIQSDALAIADMLGADSTIIRAAQTIIQKRNTLTNENAGKLPCASS